MLFNKSGHGLDRPALARLLERLRRRGDILIQDERDHPLVLSATSMEGLLDQGRERGEHYYGLTEQGGARWETEARADWSGYVSEWWRDPSEEDGASEALWTGEIACADPERLDRQISVRFPEFGQRIIPGTEKREIVAPWKATYWKTLPIGHLLTCKALHGFSGMNGKTGHTTEFDRWYCAASDPG